MTEVGHGDLSYWNPVTPQAVESMLDRLSLGTRSRVLDVGCGRGAMLIEALRRSGAHGLGIDSNARAIAAARRSADRVLPPRTAEFRAERFDAGSLEPASFDAILCVGAVHAAGGLDAALTSFGRLLTKSGRLLIGEGHWTMAPEPEYLAHIGASADEVDSHAGNLARMRAAGFAVIATHTTTPAEWEAYETGYRDRVVAWALARPDDGAAQAMRAHVLHWNEGYRRWGGDTMGFTLYLLRRA